MQVTPVLRNGHAKDVVAYGSKHHGSRRPAAGAVKQKTSPIIHAEMYLPWPIVGNSGRLFFMFNRSGEQKQVLCRKETSRNAAYGSGVFCA
jgi:hypothetical protein